LYEKEFYFYRYNADAFSLILAGCNSDSKVSGAKRAKVIDIQLTQEEYAFGVDKNQPELLAKVNEFISQIKSDGTLQKNKRQIFSDGNLNLLYLQWKTAAKTSL